MSAVPCPDPKWAHWWHDFEQWCLRGRLPSERPKTLPKSIPRRAFDCYRRLHPLPKPSPATILFVPPVAFYRGYDTLNVGITEMLEIWRGDIAIDPLYGSTLKWFDEIVGPARARGRRVYGWSRIGSRNAAWHFSQACLSIAIWNTFPNIEDDDLRAQDDRQGFLTYVRDTVPGPVGVLTNDFVSGEWPTSNPLHDLCVLPEWFPREISDPSATLAGSISSGTHHFSHSMPLFDGRDQAGLATYDYPVGPYCVWTADNVTDWTRWVR